jgi:RHS repeat-associated protein
MKKYIYTILLVWLAIVNVRAQENNEIQEPKPDEKVVVGTIGGTVDITALGGASYTIPIKVPEGIGGIQPNLSIVYNSQSGNGLLGWGWNLGGLSAITRVGHTLYHDGYVDGVDFNGDRFSLDGQRLFALDAATYGGDGTEYRTETDGMNKIVSYTETINVGGGGLFGHGSYSYKIISHFKVYTADGRILYYGKVDGEPDNARVIYESEGEKKVVMWLLKRVEDRMGNYMVYNYDIGNHDYRLNNIQYCANTHARDANEPGRGTKYGIDFHYKKNRVDKESMAIGNYFLYQPWLLERISIYHWSKPLSKYEFVYDDNSGQTNNQKYYNRLEQVVFTTEDGNALRETKIEYGQLPVLSYQGTPAQNDPNFKDYCTSIHLDGSHDGVSKIGNQLKFSGDFNGDGLTDFIAVDFNLSKSNDSIESDSSIYRSSSSYIAVYQNKGNTLTDSANGKINFDRVYDVGMTGPELIPGAFSFLDTINEIIGLKWVYVCDFNGDGLDDFVLFREMGRNVFLHAFKSSIDSNGELTFEKIRFSNTNTTTYYHNNSTSERHASFVTGDFMGRGKHDMILLPALRWNNNPRNFLYFSYSDVDGGCIVGETAGCGIKGNRFVAADFNGDGKTEIWYTLDEDALQSGHIVYIYKNSYSNEQYLFATLTENILTNKHTLFLGDINGDGKTDLLTYDKRTTNWECRLFKGTQCHSTVMDLSEPLLRLDPGNYGNSIEDRVDGIKTFVQLADFNGDGKSDIVMVHFPNRIMRIGFSPHYYDEDNGWQFYWQDDIDPISAGIHDWQTPLGHHTICVGNFLGRENSSMFDCFRLYSKSPISTYYNVKSVTDGMGNQVAFDYGYLVHNPMKPDNIYGVDYIGQNRGFDLYSVPLPMKAVRTLTTNNINVTEQAHAVDSFSYANLIVHRKGKGILGFVGITRDSWQVDYLSQNAPETKHLGKLVRTFNFKPMEEHRALVPESEELYRYRDDGEEVKTASTAYHYCKGLCQRDMNSMGIKVFAPLAKTTVADEYELLGERGHLRRRITENDYEGQQQNGLVAYQHAVRVAETRQGTDEGTPGAVSQCEFQTMTHTEYAPLLNSGDLWMPNRPLSVFMGSSRRTQGYAEAKSLTVYSYEPERPYLPKYVTTYPSGVESENDALAMTAHYTYHPTGRLKDESHYPVVGRSEDGFKTMYEYSPDNRFLTKRTEEYDLTHANDYETGYEYDNIYGNQIAETDCNGYSTWYENPDHLGLTVRSYRRDNDENRTRIAGTETVTALRWLDGSAYQSHGEGLDSPFYFTWKRSSGDAEALTIYDALGRELRTVSHVLPENGSSRIVYKDTQYDNWGRLHKVSEPYFKGLPLEQRKWTTYTYGDFDRMDTSYGIEYTVDGQPIQPYTRYEYDGLTTTTTSGVVDGDETHVTATTLNIMGWTESNSEVIDGNGTENTTTYGHNADGSLAWSMVNNNEATKISVFYDNAGNRRELTDPNYGTVTDHYNAFGQLDYTVSPKGDVTAYGYDNLGRMETRTETCHSNPGEPERLTTWNYSETPGKKGLLDGIVLKEGDNETQTIAYAYDMQHYNRLSSKTETLNGMPFTTTYAYDDPNGYPLRLKATTYPTGYTMTRDYDALTGRLRQLKHGSTVLWTTESMNALGQITRYTTGNGAVTDIAYDERHLMENQTTTASGGNILQNFSYDYDIFANLAARKDNKRNLEETFTYDHLNRLTDIWLNDVHTGHMAYDALGRMTDKRTDGRNVFSAAQHDYVGPDGRLRPHAVSSAETGDGFPQAGIQSIDYTMFDKVSSIGHGDKTLTYRYGYDHERIMMVRTDNDFFVSKTYVDNCELLDMPPVSLIQRTFLIGPLGCFAVAETINGQTQLHYVYKDHLGSWTTISDAQGNIEQEQCFDAWGNLRDPDTWNGEYNRPIMFDRGFTGHEHLNSFGLINMNGRMYDPIMSSFLSVDNYVQAPDFSQSFNRYAYCLNNPLRYVDPDGEWFLTGGVGFGKREDGYGLTSVSVGVNFGYFGFGVNLGFDNSGFSSFGVYGELGPHVGCAGANLTLSVGYDFRHSTLTGSLSANYGISLGGSCNLGVGVTGLYGYGLSTGQSSFGFGANIGASVHGDIWGIGLGGSYSRYNGHNSFGFGFSGFREMPMEVYDFGVKDNPQSKKDYCVPGALEEASRSLGIDASADFWAKSRISIVEDGEIYISPENMSDIVNMVNQSGFATSELIPVTPESLIKAHNSGQKVIAATQYKEGERYVAHGVNVRKLEVYSNTYRVYFTETSPVRQVPVYVNNLFEYGFCTFGLKH